MPVTNTNFQTSYTADGNTSVFSFAWAATETGMVETLVNGVVQNSGVTVSLSLIGAGGTVTFGTNPVSGAIVLLQRNSNLLQEDQLFDNSPLPASTVNNMVDKLTIIAQQVTQKFNNAIQLAQTLSGYTTILPTPVAGNVIGWDATGLVVTQYSPQQVLASIPNTGAGNVTGPASSTVGNIAAFNNTNGQLLEDSGIAVSSLNNWTTSAQSSSFNVGSTGNTFYPVTTTGGAVTATLPAATGSGKIRKFAVVAGTNNLTLTPNGGDTILNAGISSTSLSVGLYSGTVELLDYTSGGWIVT